MKPDREDRKQFIAAAQLRAKKNYRTEHGSYSAYMTAAYKNARIDWDRRQRTERRRKARTKSIDAMLHEPEAPGFLPGLAVADELDFLMEQIDTLWQRALRLRYLESRSVTETAAHLGVSKQAARSTIQKALKTAREVPTR